MLLRLKPQTQIKARDAAAVNFHVKPISRIVSKTNIKNTYKSFMKQDFLDHPSTHFTYFLLGQKRNNWTR